jgi:acyl-CoA synthetase (AMP-forming)/AMP-acid ligase II
MTVADLLSRRARSGDRPAFVEGATGRTLTWPEIEARMAGIEAGSRTAMTLRSLDPLETIATFVAAVAASVPVVPSDPTSPAAAVPVLPPPGAAVVMTSSGTTGRPKVIPLTEAQLLHTARSVVEHHRLGSEDRGYSPLPLSHINALVVGVLSTLVAGSTLVVDRRFSRRAFWSTIEAYEVTWINAVPGIISVLAGDLPPDPAVSRRVRFVRSASAPLAPAVRERFEALCRIGVLETYGMTEAASQITANPLCEGERRQGSVGQPVGVEVRIVRPHDRRPMPAGDVGEVEIRGPSVAAASPEDWLATADLGRLDADGFLYLAGRADDVINRGGEKVYPGEVERVLLADPRVAAAAVVGRPHPVVGEEPVAFVVAATDATEPSVLVHDLSRRCEVALSRFKVPAEVTVADALPAGPTGKVRRAALRRSLLSRSPA